MISSQILQSRLKRVAKSKWSWLTTLVLVIAGTYISLQIKSAIDSLKYALTPPELPAYVDLGQPVELNNTVWNGKDSSWFHHASQGTATLPIPYDWLIALEAPKSNPWLVFFGSEEPFMEEYILHMGFIRSQKSEWNPDGLPVGIAKTPSIRFEGIDRKAAAAGFTCAACHTGQFIHEDKRYIVNGGPAMIDLGLVTRTLGAAIGQTALSGKFSVLDGRFNRFARRVLGSNMNTASRNKLREELEAMVAALAKDSDIIDVTEGFTRLDALNRIGNQVFSHDTDVAGNYTPIDAPVNYPHIWTTSWFNWVQYDGSIMQPLIRNAGEALGVEAYVDTKGPKAQRFASSINYHNLVGIESWLAGSDPLENNRFNGLPAPEWPEALPAVDMTKASKGKALYRELCQQCHLPAITPESDFWTDQYWRPIKYVDQYQSAKETPAKYLHVNIIPVNTIGTDVAQSIVLAERTVDTTNVDLDTQVCTLVSTGSDQGEQALKFVNLDDSATSNFGLALGALVNRTNQQWFDQNYIPVSSRSQMEGKRPNCLQVGQGYKARPLNGIWATAPYLHNGSVPTLFDLLSPLKDRPQFVQLGSQVFDPKNVGILQDSDAVGFEDSYSVGSGETPEDFIPEYEGGLFYLNTHELGNHNTGHLFTDDQIKGRIGRALSQEERYQLIEYLKTL